MNARRFLDMVADQMSDKHLVALMFDQDRDLARIAMRLYARKHPDVEGLIPKPRHCPECFEGCPKCQEPDDVEVLRQFGERGLLT